MFLLTVLLYPFVLALLCGGAGLLVDRASGGVVPAMLLLTMGAAVLIVVSQLTTYVTLLAPATPYVLVAIAVAGAIVGRDRARTLLRAWRSSLWQIGIGPLAYALALAPVLLAGRPSFSSYLALADSAVHMVGADFLIRHGQDFSHLDLANSYGATIHNYYDESYPSGVDTLLGGSSFLTGLPLIWTFQPFTAFMLATATGPAWVLVRRAGLSVATGRARAWTMMAALTVTLPALVYAYELIGSIKEIVALALILSMGALVVEHRRWLWNGGRGAIPFALTVAAGVGALGVAFGAWALASAVALVAAAVLELGRDQGRGTPSVRGLVGLLAGGAFVLLLGAWPTWTNLSGSVTVAQGIASTSNPGNLHSPLHPTQLLGVWLGGSYKILPTGLGLTLTSVLVALVLLLALVGVGNVVRTGRYELALWSVPMLIVWLLVRASATTWADAKALMLTSPVVVLMAWAGIAALFAAGARGVRLLAPVLALALLGGVVASDALQYNASNLAPTARFDELASIDSRFAGRGPTLFTDFDEYSLYLLRDMDVGGPNFVYPPPLLADASGGHGRPVQLNRIAPAKLLAYPLIVTRRDPTAVRPPVAYRLLWQGVYYQVWGRRPGSRPALEQIAVAPPSAAVLTAAPGSLRKSDAARATTRAAFARTHCVRALEGALRSPTVRRHGHRLRLVAALAPQLITVPIPRSHLHRPAGWARAGERILMTRPGVLRLAFRLQRAGLWQVWLQGDVMRPVQVAVDGRPLGSLGGQLGGNTLVNNTFSPLTVNLGAGEHTLSIARPDASLAPGDGGAAVLAGVFLTPAGPAGGATLVRAPLTRWRSLCRLPAQWVELLVGSRL
ncbi:MAG: hypothetical protein WBV85_09800 [Solirubrobacteraceae bacterium]